VWMVRGMHDPVPKDLVPVVEPHLMF
jgi:hypothetical protein